MALAKAAWPAASRARKPGSAIFRQTEVGERVAASSARKSTQGLASTQAAMAARLASRAGDQGRQAADALGPAQPVEGILDHSIEGVLIVSPWKMPSISLPPLLSWKIFGSGQAGCRLSSRATARGRQRDHAVGASPPSTFCQDQVTTSSFAQGRSMAKTAEVASQMVSPSWASGIQSPSGTRTPEVVPFQVKTTSRSESTWRRDRAARRRAPRAADVRELQLLGDVGDPALAEGLPGQHIDAARAQQRPQRHLDRAGIGAGDDAEPVVGGHAEDRPAAVDRLGQLRLALLERCERPRQASASAAADQPGRLAVGPEENCVR